MREYLLPISVCLLLVIALGSWVITEYNSAGNQAYQEMVRTSDAITETLKGSIQTDIFKSRLNREHLPPTIQPEQKVAPWHNKPEQMGTHQTLQESEKVSIQQALAKTNGNRTHAAKLLGISRRALLYKLKRYIDPN